MVCDSTKGVVADSTSSGGDLFQPFRAGVAGPGHVLVTAFASNVARLAAWLGWPSGLAWFRVVGRAMERMVNLARAFGYCPVDPPDLADAHRLGYLPREKVLAACTGSRGGPQFARARLAADAHWDLLRDPGDGVMLPLRLTPGNERGGGSRPLAAKTAVALECQVSRFRVVGNGDLGSSDDQGVEFLGSVENGRLSLQADGRLEPVASDVLKRCARRRTESCPRKRWMAEPRRRSGS